MRTSDSELARSQCKEISLEWISSKKDCSIPTKTVLLLQFCSTRKMTQVTYNIIWSSTTALLSFQLSLHSWSICPRNVKTAVTNQVCTTKPQNCHLVSPVKSLPSSVIVIKLHLTIVVTKYTKYNKNYSNNLTVIVITALLCYNNSKDESST